MKRKRHREKKRKRIRIPKFYYKRIHIPREYYKISRKIHKDSPNLHTIETLRQVLMKIKLPKYSWRKFNCSRSSAFLDWYLRGMGFRTYFATSRFIRHMWLLVYLDSGKKVAVESTLLTSNYYNPPGVIDEPHSHERKIKSPYSLNPLINLLCSILFFFGPTSRYAILPQQERYYFRPYRRYKSIYNASKHVRGLDWWKAPPYRYKYPFSKW